MYTDRPLKDYLDDLAAKRPAPGGGSAAALAAAVGASLMAMVANYSVGKTKEKDLDRKISDMLDKIKGYERELRQLIDEDIRAYEKLSKGLKTVAGGVDTSDRDELYKDAIEPPFLVCELTHHCIRLCRELAICGNRNLITDTAIAAIMLEGAFFAAKYNVYINLGCVKDLDYINKVHKVLHPLEDKMPKLKEEILELCEDVISGEADNK